MLIRIDCHRSLAESLGDHHEHESAYRCSDRRGDLHSIAGSRATGTRAAAARYRQQSRNRRGDRQCDLGRREEADERRDGLAASGVVVGAIGVTLTAILVAVAHKVIVRPIKAGVQKHLAPEANSVLKIEQKVFITGAVVSATVAA